MSGYTSGVIRVLAVNRLYLHSGGSGDRMAGL